MATPLELAEKLAGAVSELYGATHRAALVTLASDHASATDSRLTVVVPFPFGVSGVVSGINLLKALRTFGEDAVLEDTADAVLVKLKRRKVSLNKLAETIDYDLPRGERKPLPPGLARACADVAPFMSLDKTRPQFTGARLFEGFFYATNNISVARSPFALDDDFSMPDFLVNYIAKREDPVGYAVTNSTITMWYADGCIVTALRLAQEMSELVPRIYDRWVKPTFQVTDDWRQDVLFALTTGSDVLTLTPDTMSSSQDVSKSEATIATPVPETMNLTKQFARPVFERAELLHFEPQMISWAAGEVSGLLTTRR